MKRITDQISKVIVAASEGETAGIVTNAFTDAKFSRIYGYKTSDDERDAPLLAPLSAVIGDEDALVVKRLSSLKETAAAECPLGASVFSSRGANLGVLKDVLFDETRGTILSLVTDKKELSPERVVSFGKGVVVLRAPEHENTRFRRSVGRTKKTERVAESPFPTVPLSEKQAADEEIQAENVESAAPSPSLFPDYDFLLGRTVLKDIVSGETIVAKAQDAVTPEVVFRARENGKLVELTVNSRKEK